MSGAELVKRSLAHVWHPCTQMRDHAGETPEIPLVPVASADGVWLTDTDGHRYLDAVSSWWTNIFGHRHPRIVDAVKAQLDRLDHVMLGGFTHEPAVRLAERLVALAPGDLNHCLYADNGSSAVEIALKLSHHYWRNQGQPGKTRYVALSGGYHGETLGALAVSGTGLYRDAYAPLLMQPLIVPSPDAALLADGDARRPGESWEDVALRRFAHMERTLAQHAGEIAAVIVEPLVQCAGGMRMYHPVYLQRLREACDRYGVHLIADEIATGFGRTGRLFACEWAGIAPDLMCLSKGLTSGTLPLAVTLATGAIYDAFYADHREGRAFLHSHSYTGNPLACSAALATLDIFDSRDWMAHNRGLGHLMFTAVQELTRHPHVAEIRQQGMILAIDLAADARSLTPYPATERRGLRVYRHALAAAGRGGAGAGAVLRPLGNTVYFMPPYVIEPEELGLLARLAIEGIDAASRD